MASTRKQEGLGRFAVAGRHQARRKGAHPGQGPHPSLPQTRGRRGSTCGSAPGQREPPGRWGCAGTTRREPCYAIPLIMRCAGEGANPRESFFLPPPPPLPPGAASQPTGVSVPPPLIPTSSAHPRPRCACAHLRGLLSLRGALASSKGVGEPSQPRGGSRKGTTV